MYLGANDRFSVSLVHNSLEGNIPKAILEYYMKTTRQIRFTMYQ